MATAVIVVLWALGALDNAAAYFPERHERWSVRGWLLFAALVVGWPAWTPHRAWFLFRRRRPYPITEAARLRDFAGIEWDGDGDEDDPGYLVVSSAAALWLAPDELDTFATLPDLRRVLEEVRW